MRAVVTGTGPQSTNLRHENEIRYRGAQMVDLRNNLAYKSPENGSRIPVHPSVTEGMFRRRRRRDCFYVPAPSDELAHIVPHCVFDKNGRFSPYYVDRCNALFESVRSDQEQLRVFEDLLGRIFYDADERVFELVANERYSDIRSELRRFSDY